MAKEFRIEAAVTLPEDMFEQAEVIAALKPVMKHLVDGVAKADGNPELVTADASVVVPKPRAARDDAGQQTMPLTPASDIHPKKAA